MSKKLQEKSSTFEDETKGFDTVDVKAPKRIADNDAAGEKGIEGQDVGEFSTDVTKAPKRLADKATVSEAFAQIFEGVELPETFAVKAEAVLEAAFKAERDAYTAQIQEEANERLGEIAHEMEEGFKRTADKYLDFVASKWLKENKVAVVSEAKVATAVSLVEGIKSLLAQHNVTIEESVYTKVDELETKLAESASRYNDLAEELMECRAEVQKLKADAIVRDVSEGLALTDASRLQSLVEEIDYTDLDKFRLKVEAVKETHFAKRPEQKDASLFEEFTPKADSKQSKIGVDLSRYLRS